MRLQRLLKKEAIAESAGIVLIFTILERILQTGRGIIFARVLGPSEYGVITMAFLFVPVFGTISRLGIPSCFPRYIPLYEKQGMLKSFINRTYFLAMSGSAVMMLLTLFFSEQITNLIYDSSEYKNVIIICLLSIIPVTLFENIRYSFNGLRVFKLSYFMSFSRFIVFTITGIGFVLVYRNAESLAVANLFTLIVIAVLFGFIILKDVAGSDSQAHKIQESGFYKKIFRYSIWFIASPIVFNLFRFVDRWMINRFMEMSDVGIYSVASNIASVVFLFGIIAGKVLMPNLSNLWEHEEKKAIVSILDLTVRCNTLILIAGSVLIMLFRHEIVGLLYGAEYINGSTVIGMLLIFWLFNSIYMTVIGYAGLIEKTYIPLISSGIGLICNILLNYILIPKYGIMGAAIATTISFGATLTIIITWFIKEGLSLKLNTVFICLLSCIFIMNDIGVTVAFLLLAVLAFGTEFLVTKDERKKLYGQFKKGIRSYIPEK